MTSPDTPLVSVCMITYNHAPYIRQAVESVLMQKTDFPIELVIGDDASTDGTSEILRELAAANPGVIRLVRNDPNLGMSKNFLATLERCRGKYVALLEGDDYWTEPRKLAMQADFLENNPAFGASCHRFMVLDSSTGTFGPDSLRVAQSDSSNGATINLDTQVTRVVMHTLTVFFLRSLADVNILRRFTGLRDKHLFAVLLCSLPACFHSFQGAVYRWHREGVHSGSTVAERAESEYEHYRELVSAFDEPALRKGLATAIGSRISVRSCTVAVPLFDRATLGLLVELASTTRSPLVLMKNLLKLFVYPLARIAGIDPLRNYRT